MQIDPSALIAQPMSRRLTLIGGRTADDDWIVICGDRQLGRVSKRSNGQWYWSLTGPIILSGSNGRETSFELAREAFRATFQRWLDSEAEHWKQHGAHNNWHPDPPEWNRGEVA